jgi:hypothetical protein
MALVDGLEARSLLGALLLTVTILGGQAAAHPQFALATVNRYSKLVLLPRGQVRLTYVLMVGDVPAMALRQGADTDRDGKLSEAEGAALARGLRDRVQQGVSLRLDGRPVPVIFEEPVLGLAGEAVAPSAFSVDLTMTLPAPPGREHELRYDDQAAIGPVGEVEILLEESPTVRLLAGWQGEARGQQTRTTRFLYQGPPASSLTDRSVGLRFLEAAPAPAPAPGQRTGWRMLLYGLALLLGAAGVAVVGRALLRPRS